jgi:hypothetical protein
MNTKLILTTAAVLLVCPLGSHVQAASPVPPVVPPITTAPTAGPVTLRYKFTVGQVHRYQFGMETNGTMLTGQSGAGIPLDTTMKMVMSQTVQSIRPADGAATILAQIDSMQMFQNGKEIALPSAQQAQMKKPSTIVMLPSGKTLSADIPSLDSTSMPGMDVSKGMFTSTALLPDGPVKVGDTWTGAVATAMAGVQSNFISVITGLDSKNGVSMATISQKQMGKIHMTMSKGMPMTMTMAGTVTGDGTQIFDTDAGAVQSMTSTAATAMTMTFGKMANGTAPPAGMPQSMKMQMQTKLTMERLSDQPSVSVIVPNP